MKSDNPANNSSVPAIPSPSSTSPSPPLPSPTPTPSLLPNVTSLSLLKPISDLYNLHGTYVIEVDVLPPSCINDEKVPKAATGNGKASGVKFAIPDTTSTSTNSNLGKDKRCLSWNDEKGGTREVEGGMRGIGACCDFVTLTIKDQFVSRSDMFLHRSSLMGRWVYEGKRMVLNGVKITVKECRSGRQQVKSGVVDGDTKFGFRTRSARIIWLVQMGSEMWDYGTGRGNVVNFDKFVGFMRKVFERWER